MAPIERITLFKIPNEADQLRVLEQYKVLAKTATKVRCFHCFIQHVPALHVAPRLAILANRPLC